MHERLRYGIFRWWSQLIARRPGCILIICGSAALLALLVTVVGLDFQSDRNALIKKDLGWNQRFLDWQENFPGVYDLFVVVDADPNGEGITPQKLIDARALVDDLSRELLKDESVILVVPDFDAGQIVQARTLLKSVTLSELMAHVTGQFRHAPTQEVDTVHVIAWINQLGRLVDLVGQHLAASDEEAKDFTRLDTDGPDPERTYLTSEKDRLFFIRVTPDRDPKALNALAESINSIRRIIEHVSKQHPGLDVGLTGLEVIETDETAAAIRDTTIASLLALGLITVLLVLAFHSWRTPLLAAVSLLVGITWSFGFLTVTIGHLQVISVVFTMILLGLGIAYGIHLASRFELVRHQYADNSEGFRMALCDSFETMGPGIVTGAVTTAAALATTIFTDFKGVAEMGLIAAVGILLCLLAMFSVFPALLRLKKSKHRHVVPMQDRFVHFFEDRWVMPFVRWPKLTLLVAVLVTGLSALAIAQMHFDYNLMKLQPRNVDSVTWQQRVAENSERSIWFGVSVCENLDQAGERARKFLRCKNVSAIGGVGILFPGDAPADDDKRAKVRNTPTSLGDSGQTVAPSADEPEPTARVDLAAQLTAMQFAMKLATATSIPERVKPALGQLNQAIHRAVSAVAVLEPQQRQERFARLEREYARWRLQRVNDVIGTSPLMRPFREIGRKGRVILEVYPKLPAEAGSDVDGPLHPDFLPQFYRQLSSVDPNVTGSIVQIYLSGKLIKDSYIRAGVGALIVVFLLVLLDFRRLDDAFLCLIPVGVGFVVTFGVMWLLGMGINPANIIVLPLMFGIGVDSGVHILHRYRQDPHTRPLGLSHGTGKGITVTSLTTVIGFGCMMLARHRGIFSLGFVLAVGVLMTTLACWTVMPAWLELRERAKQRQESGVRSW